RVGIASARNHPRHASRHNGVRARRGSPVVRAGLQRDVERRPPRTLPRGLERGQLRMRRPCPRVPALADDLAVRYDNRADERMRVLDLVAPALSELERPLDAHATASASERYARAGSSLPNTDVAATKSRAPASNRSAMFFGPTPPSTWIATESGSRSRSRLIRPIDSGMNG